MCLQVHKLEASLRGQKEALEVEVRGTAGQADTLREQVGQLRNQASHALAASEDKLRSMHAHYDDLARYTLLLLLFSPVWMCGRKDTYQTSAMMAITKACEVHFRLERPRLTTRC